MWSSVKKKVPPINIIEAQEAPVSRIAAAIIHQAVREKAASAQLVPSETGMRVEYLLGDVWTKTMLLPKRLEPEITAHLKEMAGLPTEYRMAMQGLILIRSALGAQVLDMDKVPVLTAAPLSGEQDYDVHLFVTPTRQGEMITLNIEAVGGSPE